MIPSPVGSVHDPQRCGLDVDSFLSYQCHFAKVREKYNPPLPRPNVELACVVQDFGHSRHTCRGIPCSFNIKMEHEGIHNSMLHLLQDFFSPE